MLASDLHLQVMGKIGFILTTDLFLLFNTVKK